LELKRGPISDLHLDVDRITQHQDGSAKFVHGDGAKAPATQVYEDKHGLPVMYEESAPETKKKSQTETDTISVLWHELISPLTLIKGYTATLLQLNDAITEEQKQQYLRGIDTASNRVIRLLENLRDITRLEESDAITFLRISLPDLLRQVASEMQNQTTKHVIKVRPCPRLPLVTADPEKIELIISNILVNAMKYSPNGGDIEVEIRAVQTEQELRRLFHDAPLVKLPCLIVSIADSGIGISEAELDRIFEKFYRVNHKLAQSTPGAGLGLYICKIIIEAHNGQIWARNRLHTGSVFYFSLPMNH
jgi:signal transduction histidine kinase